MDRGARGFAGRLVQREKLEKLAILLKIGRRAGHQCYFVSGQRVSFRLFDHCFDTRSTQSTESRGRMEAWSYRRTQSAPIHAGSPADSSEPGNSSVAIGREGFIRSDGTHDEIRPHGTARPIFVRDWT